MSYALICTVAFVASVLSFFTGFGLGTLVLPAFAVFFPTEAAVALTAVVHLLNSLFRVVLIGRRANLGIAVRFGIPAVLAAFAGAAVLVWLTDQAPLYRYEFAGRAFQIVPVTLVIALLMVGFGALEVWPRAKRIAVPPAYLPIGGVLTGFFGGLSGHQGALRSAFLLRAGLGKEAFIATGVVIAAVVDLARLAVYFERFFASKVAENGPLVGSAALAAFAGALLGNQLVEKVSLRSIEITVAALLVLVGLGLGAGVL